VGVLLHTGRAPSDLTFHVGPSFPVIEGAIHIYQPGWPEFLTGKRVPGIYKCHPAAGEYKGLYETGENIFKDMLHEIGIEVGIKAFRHAQISKYYPRLTGDLTVVVPEKNLITVLLAVV
jgi:hypothetical protein